MKTTKSILTATLCAAAVLEAGAYNSDRNVIYVNSDVTTHIIMPENLKLVDISTEKIIGNQCADNMVRIKPVPEDSIDNVYYRNDEFLGTITMIGERHIAQYDVLYTSRPQNATSIYNVDYGQTERYSNPEVAMPESEMARIAWSIYGSKRKFNNIRTHSNGVKGEVFNIYSVGDYFFIDFGLDNKTNIEYDIDEIRVSLADKKETKATNSQTIQLEPVFILNDTDKFKKHYRQVLVLNKLTFPDEKILNIAVSEKQISGRTVNIPIEYADILNADGIDMQATSQRPSAYSATYVVAQPTRTRDDYTKILKENNALKKRLEDADSEIKTLKKKTSEAQRSVADMKDNQESLLRNTEKENQRLSRQLLLANQEIENLKQQNSELTVSYNKMEAAYQGANETINKILSKEKQ